MKISVYIIAYNQVDKISDSINSVLWADEIIVADSNSTDGTIELAESLGAKVVQIPFNGFGDLRNQAVSFCQYNWIFSLDTDERCTPEAQKEILELVKSNEHDVYYVPRRNFFMGKKIRFSGWYPNYRQPQLFKKGSMTYKEDQVHEGFILQSKRPIGHMKNPIIQIPFKDFSELMDKANRYSSLGAARLQAKYPHLTMGKALLSSLWSFVKHYILKRGFLDGWPGFIIALGNFYGTFYRYAKCYENQQQWNYTIDTLNDKL